MGINPSVGAMENFAKTDTDWSNMIEAGPWMFAKHPFIFHPWVPDADLYKKGSKKVPIWIRVPHLSFQFWNEEMLSKIATYVGTPLYADDATSEMSHLSFARVHVEVEVKCEMPNEVPLVNESGKKVKPVIRKKWQAKVTEQVQLVSEKVVAQARQHISVANTFDALEEKDVVSEAELRNDKDERKSLWEFLRQDKRRVGDQPWILGGDFNVVRSVSEALGGNVPDGEAMDDLNDCLRDCELLDHPHEGCFYTWCRNWETQSLLRVLDKVQRIKMLKNSLNELYEKEFSHISARVLEKKYEVGNLQAKIFQGVIDGDTMAAAR
ncbi:hypothetical protein LIER_17653 [Lithospermum erythrorhizon]|uniref:DUF4283 domain-containing protein n=1 Tax=Lithospermum erythrorhizon TaxID=34254 RepID=A0AAV3QDI7_LITER